MLSCLCLVAYLPAAGCPCKHEGTLHSRGTCLCWRWVKQSAPREAESGLVAGRGGLSLRLLRIAFALCLEKAAAYHTHLGMRYVLSRVPLHMLTSQIDAFQWMGMWLLGRVAGCRKGRYVLCLASCVAVVVCVWCSHTPFIPCLAQLRRKVPASLGCRCVSSHMGCVCGCAQLMIFHNPCLAGWVCVRERMGCSFAAPAAAADTLTYEAAWPLLQTAAVCLVGITSCCVKIQLELTAFRPTAAAAPLCYSSSTTNLQEGLA